jgi:glyoxylase-like metal-dependent hydrolase (beta-lactamase superfamily II)
MIVSLFCMLAPLAWAQDFEKFTVQTTPLSEQVYLLQGAGGNVAACVGQNGVLLVDSDYTPMSDKLKAAVDSLSDQPVRIVINTHWHFDHVGGNENFAHWGSVIVSHENVRKRMAAAQYLEIIDREVPASPPAALPTLTFQDSLSLHCGDETISAVHLPPAHTDGDAIVHFRQANVIHTGDIFFNGGYPFIDIAVGGNIDGMIAAVESILALCNEETRIIPGHGPLASKADLEAYGDMLREFRAIVAAEMAASKDLETIQAEQPTAALDEKWGKFAFPANLFTEMVFRTLDESSE